MTPATSRLRSVAARIFASKTMERLIDPVLADIELERCEALRCGRLWLARWVVFRGYVALISAVVVHAVHTNAVMSVTSGAARTAAFSAAAFFVLTFALVVRPWMRSPLVMSYAEWVHFGVYLIPQSLPVSVPLALAIGIIGGWSQSILARTAIRRAALLGFVGILFTLSAMEWMIPAANERFRAAVTKKLEAAGRIPRLTTLRGVSERPLSELASQRRRGTLAAVTTGTVYYAPDSIIVQRLEDIFHRRVALAFAAGPFCLAAAAIALLFRRRVVAVLALCAVLLLYIAAMFAVEKVAMPVWPIARAWLPNAALLTIAIALLLAAPPRAEGVRS